MNMSELLLVFFIALLVIKPEQIPHVAHQVGRYVRILRKLWANTKEEVEGVLNAYKHDEKK